MNHNIPIIYKKMIKSASFGNVCIIWSAKKNHPLISHILLSKPGLSAERLAAKLFPGLRISSCREIDAIADSIKAYLEGENVRFSLRALDLSPFSKFQQSVLRAQYLIPRGSVSTYGLIAAYVGAPGGARAVGNVMARNPFPLIIPCHRTIRSGYQLGGFGGGTEMKRALLKREGLVFDEAGRVICRRLHYSHT